MWGDQEDVRQVRRHALRLAESLRADATSLSGAGHVQWDSTAASAFRAVLADEVRVTRNCAEDLEQAAGLLEAHARSVDEHLAVLRHLGVG
jgi:hypothetical protein